MGDFDFDCGDCGDCGDCDCGDCGDCDCDCNCFSCDDQDGNGWGNIFCLNICITRQDRNIYNSNSKYGSNYTIFDCCCCCCDRDDTSRQRAMPETAARTATAKLDRTTDQKKKQSEQFCTCDGPSNLPRYKCPTCSSSLPTSFDPPIPPRHFREDFMRGDYMRREFMRDDYMGKDYMRRDYMDRYFKH